MSNLVGRRIGHYEIIEEIGRGGMATVYKAFQKSLSRYVAIKVLPIESSKNQELVERFRREALSAGKLSHSNILHIYDAGSTDEFHYIIMDYVPTGTLKEKMEQGTLDIKTATRLGAQVADALNHAHNRGIIHRDLKPSNVLLTEEGNALLADFGIAHAVGETRLTRTGTSIGTPEYMSPEQCQGQEVDARSDIYSLGIVVYEMLAGIVPFQANTPLATLYKHINEPPPPLRQVNMRVPPELERIVMKTLAKDPDARYHSAGEFARALRGESVAAKADTAATRLVEPREKTPKKPQTAPAKGMNKAVVALIALLAVALIGGLGYWFLGRDGGEAEVTPTTIAVAPVTKEPTDTKIPPTATNTPLQPSETPVPSTETPIRPTATERIVIITATSAPPTPTERVIIITATPLPATDTPIPTNTSLPTDTPEPTKTPEPTTKSAAPPTPPPTAPPPPDEPSVVLDFEQMGAWRRGDEPNGTFTQSSAQTHAGSYSGKLDYDFGSAGNDYVVFMQTREISGKPNLLKLWVYGDGSGHLLNAWIKDGAGQVWQTTFGAVDHQGWKEMLALIEAGQEWPWAHISGPNNGIVDYPIAFSALVLDDIPDSYTGKGAIYVDTLSAEEYELPVASTQPTTAAPAEATSAPSAPSGAINVAALQGSMAFDVTRPGYPYADVWLMNANGTGMNILVEGAGWPALRPDGRQILYKGLASNRLRIFRIDRDGSFDTPLTEYTEDTMPSWAPYATMIVFASKRDVRKQWELFTMTADGQNQTRILANVSSRMPVWIPGPIIYSGCLVKDPGKCGLVAVNEDGSGGRLITDNTNDMQPSASPDGQWIAFMSLRDGNWEIYKAPVSGGAVQRLTEHPAHDGLPAWSPYGDAIAFASNRDGVWAIYVMRTDGSAVTKITDLKGDYLNWPEGRLQWSRDD